MTEQPTGNFLLDIRRYHELHPSRNRPTTFSSSSSSSSSPSSPRRWRNCPRMPLQISPHVFVRVGPSRDVSNLCLRNDSTRESGQSQVTNGKAAAAAAATTTSTTRTRTTAAAAAATCSFVPFTVHAPLRYSDVRRRRGVNSRAASLSRN